MSNRSFRDKERKYSGILVMICACIWLSAGGCSPDTDLASGEAAYASGEYDRALEILLPHAEAGNVRAQFLAGLIYQGRWDGADHKSSNKRKAIKWLSAASDRGHAPAQGQLGTLLLIGFSVSDKQRERAVALLRTAAESGDVTGQVTLGVEIAMSEKLGQPGHETGLVWLEKAAAQKNAGAFHWLAQIREIDAGYAHHRGNTAQARDLMIEVLKWTLLNVLVTGEFEPAPAAAIVRKYKDPYDEESLTETVRRAAEWVEENDIEGIDVDTVIRKLKDLRHRITIPNRE